MTRRKELQIMQISLNKFQDGNNHDNSVLRKYDDFFKDNKNIENEMYFYRKPRIDKVFYQAEIKKKKNLRKKNQNLYYTANAENFKNNGNNNSYEENNKHIFENCKEAENFASEYFENSENGDNLKVRR